MAANNAPATPNRTSGTATVVAPRSSAPNDGDSVENAAQRIRSTLDGGDPRPSGRGRGERRGSSDLDAIALESLRAEDHDPDDNGGHDEDDPDAEDLTHQRDDDAPVDDSPDDPDDPTRPRDDDDIDPDDPDGEDDDPRVLKARVQVKVNGKVQSITVAEAIKGYQRHGDYSRGTEANARKSQELDSHLATAMQQRQALDQVLVHYAQQIDYAYGQEPNWDQLYQENPLEFVRQRAAFDKRNKDLSDLMSLRQQNAQLLRSQVEQRTRAALEDEAKRMFDRHPDWKDPVKGKAFRQRITKYLETYGYKPEEISIVDARHLEIADKAERYDALMARARKRELSARRDDVRSRDDGNTDEPAPRVIRPARPSAAPRPLRPSERSRKELDAAKKTAARSGRVEDAAAAIARLNL